MTEIIGAHLVGSAPVDSPTQLFELAERHLDHRLLRLPDGEVSERDTWIRCQYAKLAQCPQLSPEAPDASYLGRELQQFVVTDDSVPLELVELGYAEAALNSWESFRGAREQGLVAPHQRFMVGLALVLWHPETTPMSSERLSHIPVRQAPLVRNRR